MNPRTWLIRVIGVIRVKVYPRESARLVDPRNPRDPRLSFIRVNPRAW